MAGIEDLTNIMMAGGRGDVPPPVGMGGPPPGGPPPGMGEMAAAGGSPMGEEPPMDIEQDSAMLAGAGVGRAQGDIGQAIAVLDTAKAMLVASVEQPPMDGMGGPPPGMGGPPMDPGMGGPPMQAAYGRPLMRRGGGPLYRQGGGGMSESDILRQMVMDSLQEGRAPSDRDVAFRTEMLRKALGQGQTGRTLSDKDLARHLETINSPRVRPPTTAERDRALQRLMRYRRS